MSRKDKKNAVQPEITQENIVNENNNNENVNAEANTFQNQTQYDRNDKLAKEHLQAYYDKAYLAERDRLDAIFGPLELFDRTKDVVEKVVYKDPDLTNYVEKVKFNKQKKKTAFFVCLSIIAIIAAVVFAVLFFTK